MTLKTSSGLSALIRPSFLYSGRVRHLWAERNEGCDVLVNDFWCSACMTMHYRVAHLKNCFGECLELTTSVTDWLPR